MVNGKNRSGQIRSIKFKNRSRVSFSSSGISKIPSKSGVYKIGCGPETYYIGSTNDLKRRAKEHKRNGNDGCFFSFVQTRTRKQAFSIEKKNIGSTCPTRNKTKPTRCKSNWERWFGF